MKRSIVFLLAAVAVLSLPAAGSAAPRIAPWSPPAVEAAAAGWTYSGCWSPRTGAPCVDIYRDANGDAWKCKACGTTKGPGPGKCTRVSERELADGLWCS